MGPGYIYNGRRTGLGIGFTPGAVALTYVELQLQHAEPTLHTVMFVSVFVINTCFAMDAYQEAKHINS